MRVNNWHVSTFTSLFMSQYCTHVFLFVTEFCFTKDFPTRQSHLSSSAVTAKPLLEYSDNDSKLVQLGEMYFLQISGEITPVGRYFFSLASLNSSFRMSKVVQKLLLAIFALDGFFFYCFCVFSSLFTVCSFDFFLIYFIIKLIRVAIPYFLRI